MSLTGLNRLVSSSALSVSNSAFWVFAFVISSCLCCSVRVMST